MNSCLRGFSLVELLVAMGLSLMMATGFIELYITSIKNHEIYHALSLMQNNARIATTIIAHDLRMTGYIGCPQLSKQFVINNFTHSSLSLETSLQGYSGNPKNIVPKRAVADSDVLSIRREAELSGNLKRPMTSLKKMQISERLVIKPSQVVIISDCQHADMFYIDQVIHDKAKALNTLVSTHQLSQHYSRNAQIARYFEHIYYIGNTGRLNRAGQSIRALYRSDNDEPDQELIEGVAAMKINYGILEDGLHYYPAATINSMSAWAQVKNIRIDLLLKTLDDILVQPQAYYFQDQLMIPPDRKIYKEWIINVDLRERS